MSALPGFEIAFRGGPLHGCLRHVECLPYELATPVAMPIPHTGDRRACTWEGDSQPVAIYQLKNDNGDWRYVYLWTTTAAALGVEQSFESQPEGSLQAELETCC